MVYEFQKRRVQFTEILKINCSLRRLDAQAVELAELPERETKVPSLSCMKKHRNLAKRNVFFADSVLLHVR
jgi:hypothetical protein